MGHFGIIFAAISYSKRLTVLFPGQKAANGTIKLVRKKRRLTFFIRYRKEKSRHTHT